MNRVTLKLDFTISKIAGLIVIIGGLIVSAINKESSLGEIAIISGCSLIGVKTFVSRNKGGNNETQG